MRITIEGENVIIAKADFARLLGGTPVIELCPQTDKQEDLDTTVSRYLDKKGFKHNVLGFKYLHQAILLCLDYSGWVYQVTNLYEKVAEYQGVKGANVERAIRHSLEIVYGADKPTNSEFIAAAAEEIRLSLK